MFYNRAREFAFPQHLQQRRIWPNRLDMMSGLHPLQNPFACTAPWSSQIGYATPETDVLELDEQYLLEIALPGVVLDDIELKAEEYCITVIAKRTPAMFEERANYLRKELPAGYLVRQFEFDTPILHEQVEARMDRGILFVSIPKLDVALRVPVSAGSIEGHVQGVRTRVHSGNQSPKSETIRSGKEVTIK